MGVRQFSNLVCFRMSLPEDRNWAAKIYQERAVALDADQNVTYFFLKDYPEICRYMRYDRIRLQGPSRDRGTTGSART